MSAYSKPIAATNDTDNSPAALADLLGQGKLGQLTREAERRRNLTHEVRAKLPPDEARHVVSATRSEAGELVVAMDSSTWAARVRYRGAELAAPRLKVKVSPGSSVSSPGP